jgi:hypothetical protein
VATVMVDFDTSSGRDFAALRPIGVWVAHDDGSIEVRYLPEVEDGEDLAHANYLRTLRSIEEPLQEFRSGTARPDFHEILRWITEGSYLGLSYRTVASIGSITLDEAWRRFVIDQEALPVQDPVSS